MEETVKKRIRFVDSNYATVFFIDDGGEIEIRIDGKWKKVNCRYIDDYHAEIGRNVYHIHEFAQRMGQSWYSYRPVFKTPGYPVMIQEIIDAFLSRNLYSETRQEMADEYREAINCLRIEFNKEEDEPKTKDSVGYLYAFLDGYFCALNLIKQAEADHA